ncbi:MAG TPA: adenylate kinase [Actinobacteria bacterium]|nr:adenylate kinase [Actinomycetota bacterium]
MRIVMLGAPGAGKGTQADKISKKFEIPHVSTGDILRKEIRIKSRSGLKAKEYVESGKLVPDELIVDIIENFIKGDKTEKGFLMDGFPRNISQAKVFSNMLDRIGSDLDKVINITVDNDEIIQRLGSRRICVECHQIASSAGEKHNGICPKCGAKLIKRRDDEEEVIRHRLQVYEKETSPLIGYYRGKGILVDIKGTGTEEEVTERIFEKL